MLEYMPSTPQAHWLLMIKSSLLWKPWGSKPKVLTLLMISKLTVERLTTSSIAAKYSITINQCTPLVSHQNRELPLTFSVWVTSRSPRYTTTSAEFSAWKTLYMHWILHPTCCCWAPLITWDGTWKLEEERSCLRMGDREEVLDRILKDDGLYHIQAELLTNTTPTSLAAKVVPLDIKLWHWQCRHMGENWLNEVLKLVDRMIITEGLHLKPRCKDCIRANHWRWPFYPVMTYSNVPLELLAIVIWGPTHIPTVGGNLYAMHIVDTGTSKRFCVPIPNHTAMTTLNVIDAFKAEEEWQTGHILKKICNDNAPEFQSGVWEEWFHQYGIIHEFTAAYSSPSNGVTERSISILTGAMGAMLLDTKLNAKWWGEAMKVAAHVSNYLLSLQHPGKIPEESWSGQCMDMFHLRVWGCICYAHIPEEHRGKLDLRGIKCQLIGYESGGIYCCKVWNSDDVIQSRDVVFEEGDITGLPLLRGRTVKMMKKILLLTQQQQPWAQPLTQMCDQLCHQAKATQPHPNWESRIRFLLCNPLNRQPQFWSLIVRQLLITHITQPQRYIEPNQHDDQLVLESLPKHLPNPNSTS